MNEKKLTQITSSMSDSITEGIAEAMKPVFENLATEIHSMMSKVRQEQKNTLQFMSEQFLENMKASGENMFKGMLDRTPHLLHQHIF